MLKALKFFIIACFCLLTMGCSVLYGFASFFWSAPDMEQGLTPDAASQLFDDKGNVIYTTQSVEKRIPITADKMPKHLRNAFIAVEDNRFYEHSGIDYRGTARAIVSTLSGHEVQGGSTITQQLAKNAFLTQERSLIRKVKEAFLAKELESKYTKDEILTMYLNHIYFGQGTYGVESAAMFYFGKHAQNLNIAESATLAAIPKSPNYYNPFENEKASKDRKELVISQMVKYKLITPEEGQQAKDYTIKLDYANKKKEDYDSYFYDMVIQKVIDKFGADALYKGGLKIYTTLNTDMQRAAANAVANHLPSFYTDEKGLTQPQTALVAVDPHTGHIKALVGGRGQDKFNRAFLATRQPGSAFKPFVYLTAMQNGFTPASVIEDKEEEFSPGWKPRNSDWKWHGIVSLRTALKNSLNVPTIKLAREVGIDKVISNAEKMGISTLITSGQYNDTNLSAALGGLSQGVTPLEMAAAYGVLATNGLYAKPITITKVLDRDGKIIMEQDSPAKRVINAEAAYLTTNMLQDVLISGTAGGASIGREAAGKTGTTDESKDAWFVGYTPNISCAVWVGDDNNKSMGRMYGSGAPLNIWHSFMSNGLGSVPASSFHNPGVTIPPEPNVKKLEEEEKKKKEEAEKGKNNATIIIDNNDDKKDDKNNKTEERTSKKRRSLKERINEIKNKAAGVKPVVSNEPTPR